jgi:hypothetical protein
MLFRLGTTGKVEIDAHGAITLVGNLDITGDLFHILNADSTRNGEALGLGDILLGLNTGTAHNVLWDYSEGKMLFRLGTTGKVEIDAHGAITLVGNLGITGDIVTPDGSEVDWWGNSPADSGGAVGTAATRLLHALAATGGNTTIVTSGQGGPGGEIYFGAGAGGVAASVVGAYSSTGGTGGTLNLLAGDGGNAASAANTNIGGLGGTVNFRSGSGGAATAGATRQGGNGGTLNVDAGDAGVGTSSANGGILNLQSGQPQSGGASVLNIGTDHATDINIGQSSPATAVTVKGKFAANNATPQAKATHLIDATDLATALTRISGILVILENFGLMATS